jgi:hypothetical protein
LGGVFDESIREYRSAGRRRRMYRETPAKKLLAGAAPPALVPGAGSAIIGPTMSR